MRTDCFFRVFGVVRGYSFGAVARPAVTTRSWEFWPEIFEMVFGVVNIFSPNKTLHATAVGVAFERPSARLNLLFPSEAGAHPAVRELDRWTNYPCVCF
jgi:hypothetical protein